MGYEMSKENKNVDTQKSISYENTLSNVLSDEERNDVAQKYDVSDSAKSNLYKRNGVVYLGSLTIEEWHRITSEKDNIHSRNN